MSYGNKGKIRAFLVETFDILFVMVLCFVTLLTTMLMRGKVIVGAGSGGGLTYTFNMASFAFTASFLVIYLVYIIHHSEGELKNFYAAHYDSKEKRELERNEEKRAGRNEG